MSTSAEQVGQCELGSHILIGPVGMESIEASSSLEVDQRNLEVIGAEKPVEGTPGACRPLRAAICACRGKAGCNCRSRVDRLLIELCRRPVELAEAFCSNRPEAT